MSESRKRTKCAVCGNKNLITILNYGDVPLAGFFPKKDQLKKIKKYGLSLQYCPECHLIQTNSVIDASVLFKDYRYMSSVSLQKHFNEYAEYLVNKFKLNIESKILEIGSNDGNVFNVNFNQAEFYNEQNKPVVCELEFGVLANDCSLYISYEYDATYTTYLNKMDQKQIITETEPLKI